MRLPERPTELRTTLREHAETEDAPVFIYDFPSPEEEADFMMNSVSALVSSEDAAELLRGIEDEEEMARAVYDLIGSGKVKLSKGYGRFLCQIFDERILRIEHLEMGEDGEPFDRERHLDQIPGPWKMEVAREIQTRVKSYLTELEVGNSSSPSRSGVTEGSTPGAAADDASSQD